MVDVVRQVWKQETGLDLDTIPQDLGKFELGSDECHRKLEVNHGSGAHGLSRGSNAR
jgi:hypothetical protein